MFEVEGKGGQVECFMTLDDRLHEGIGWDHDVAGSVDDLEINS